MRQQAKEANASRQHVEKKKRRGNEKRQSISKKKKGRWWRVTSEERKRRRHPYERMDQMAASYAIIVCHAGV
jgi:hypothetical protein